MSKVSLSWLFKAHAANCGVTLIVRLPPLVSLAGLCEVNLHSLLLVVGCLRDLRLTFRACLCYVVL